MSQRGTVRRLLDMRRARCLVLALDGVSHADLATALDEGRAPTLEALRRGGTLMPLRSSLPPVSAVAWASFMTACNPGRHGIFGFTHPRTDDYGTHFPSSSDLRTPTLWDRAATDGLRSVVVNLPGTYPARKMNGVLVAGFVAPTLARACHPPALADRLAGLGYRVDVDVGRADDEAEFVEHVLEVVDRRIQAMELLLLEESWSLAVLSFTELDRLQHLAYRRMRDPNRPAGAAMRQWLARIDAFLDRTLDRYADISVLAVSDHGFGPLERYVNLEAWLEGQGFIDGVDADRLALSRAFSMDPGRVYVNAGNVFDRGTVPAEQVRGLVSEIAAGLADLTDPSTGAPIMEQIVTRPEAYSGPRARFGPNLVCIPGRGYELKSSRRLPILSSVTGFEGTHTYSDAFFLSDRPVAHEGGSIQDAGASVLARLRLQHEDVDGRSLLA